MSLPSEQSTDLEVFDKFPDLPTEIRCQIWKHAALYRPRVIQVSYDADNSLWRACKDSCGGLPNIVHVSQEARAEALRPYTKVFGANINLRDDVIFISDPCFTLRKPRKDFLQSEYTKQLKNVAFSNEVFSGLQETRNQFTAFVDSPVSILRKFEGLKHFTMVLSDDFSMFDMGPFAENDSDHDSVGNYYHSDFEDDDDDGGSIEEREDHQVEADIDGGGPSAEGDEHQVEDVLGDANSEQNNQEEVIEERPGPSPLERLLQMQEKYALEKLKQGYFRHVGNIHFKSAMQNPDHWDDWDMYLENLEDICKTEKEAHPTWIRPTMSIMSVSYGLKRAGDFDLQVHSLGDHTDGVVELGGPPEDSEWDSNDLLGDSEDDNDHGFGEEESYFGLSPMFFS